MTRTWIAMNWSDFLFVFKCIIIILMIIICKLKLSMKYKIFISSKTLLDLLICYNVVFYISLYPFFSFQVLLWNLLPPNIILWWIFILSTKMIQLSAQHIRILLKIRYNVSWRIIIYRRDVNSCIRATAQLFFDMFP